MLIARTEKKATELHKLIQQRKVSKEYLCKVQGVFPRYSRVCVFGLISIQSIIIPCIFLNMITLNGGVSMVLICLLQYEYKLFLLIVKNWKIHLIFFVSWSLISDLDYPPHTPSLYYISPGIFTHLGIQWENWVQGALGNPQQESWPEQSWEKWKGIVDHIWAPLYWWPHQHCEMWALLPKLTTTHNSIPYF